MSDEIQEWLYHIAEDEAQLKRLRKKVREIDEQEERDSGGQDGDEAVLREGSEASWKEIEERKIREKEDIEELTETAQDRRDMVEGAESLRIHNEQVLREFGLWRGGKVITESKKEKKSGKVQESLITEPIKKLTSVSYGKTHITEEGKHKVGDVKEGMTMCGPGLWLPNELAENGTDDEILEYLQENHIKLV